jgi:hypothetical protein
MPIETLARPELVAHRAATAASFADVVRDLSDTLGKKLTAYLAGVKDARAIDRWITGSKRVHSIRYELGTWFERWKDDHVLANRRILELDAKREAPAKLLARYFVQRRGEAKRSGRIVHRVRDLFVETATEIDRGKNPQRSRDWLEGTLATPHRHGSADRIADTGSSATHVIGVLAGVAQQTIDACGTDSQKPLLHRRLDVEVPMPLHRRDEARDRGLEPLSAKAIACFP